MSISAIFGALFFMSLSALDYYVTPENFKRFLIYRITISLFLCLLYLLNKLKRKLYYQYLLIICRSYIIGNHNRANDISTSEVINQPLLCWIESAHCMCFMGFTPLIYHVSLGLSLSLIYSIYLFPILIYDQIIDLQDFLSIVMFLLFQQL